MISQIKKAAKVLKEDGLQELTRQISLILMCKYGRILPFARCKWNAGLRNEMDFWDDYFRTKGSRWPDYYAMQLNPDFPLQPRPAALLPPQPEVHILDVGAGPLSYVGKIHQGKHLRLTAVDPLADQYDRILKKYGIEPPTRTRRLAAEKLTKHFHSNTFDLVFARNCIDHSYNPERAILQMIDVAKKGSYVLLEHVPNEAENEGYLGLHQWNFSMSSHGDFIIRSKSRTVNMTQKYAASCKIECELMEGDKGGQWLITRIQKK